MLFHFRINFPQLNPFWDKYLEFQQRLESAGKNGFAGGRKGIAALYLY